MGRVATFDSHRHREHELYIAAYDRWIENDCSKLPSHRNHPLFFYLFRRSCLFSFCINVSKFNGMNFYGIDLVCLVFVFPFFFYCSKLKATKWQNNRKKKTNDDDNDKKHAHFFNDSQVQEAITHANAWHTFFFISFFFFRTRFVFEYKFMRFFLVFLVFRSSSFVYWLQLTLLMFFRFTIIFIAIVRTPNEIFVRSVPPIFIEHRIIGILASILILFIDTNSICPCPETWTMVDGLVWSHNPYIIKWIFILCTQCIE